MSAITGIFMRNGKNVDPELMKKMNDKLSHRGPDGSDIWCEGPIGLGHQMLWTTPESLHEQLPYEENGLIITADARIDNRDELSKELDIKDEENVSDSYFILKSYEKWGEECPDKLLGDFAFAIWDKAQEKLFCARDHMGVKPFYYYLDDDMFVFGTEIKALFCVEGVPYKLNERKVAIYLMKDTSDKEITFYKDILSLASANLLILTSQNIHMGKYWKLDPELCIKMDSENEYVNAFLEIFTESVKCRSRSYFPIGAELSGGLDSSSIVCMLKKIINKNTNLETINTFSRVFDETPECDERHYTKNIVNYSEIKHHPINVDNISPLDNIEMVLWHQDQPFSTPHMTKQIRSYQEMNKKNIRILLSGQGGDEIVSIGKNYLKELFVTFQWKKLIKEMKGHSKNYNKQIYNLLLEKVIFPSVPYKFRKKMRVFIGKDVDSILNPGFLEKLMINDNNYDLDRLNKITSKEYHYHSLNSAYAENTLEVIDRNVASFDIEARYPFYDKRLVEFCYALPTEMKLKFGWGKYILRLAMENILPVEIQWRNSKTDLSPSYEKNFLLFEKDTLKRLIYNENQLISDYINLEKFKDILNKRASEGEQDLFDVWLVVLLDLWLKYADISS